MPQHPRATDDLTLIQLPHPEVTRTSVGHQLVEFGFADDLAEGERLAARLFPDLPGKIFLED